MYRGRPPPREGYLPPFDSRGPLRPPRPYPAPDYRDDRSRPRPPSHHSYHGHPDSYRRSPLRRRYPSPGTGSHRGGEHWAGGPPRERSLSPRGTIPLDHNLVITVGNELTAPPGPATLHHHERDFPPRPEYERSRSQSQSWDQGMDWNRNKNLRRTQSRSPDRSWNRSRGRSKSRHSSRSRSRSRSRRRSRGRSFSKAGSCGRGKSRHPSHSISNTSSSSSDGGDEKSRREFKELETARRRKELEEMLSLPTKSILKKRNDCDDSSVRSGDSPRVLDTSNMSRMADQLLQAVRGMEPHMVASVLSELRSDPQMSHRPGLDAEITEILNLLRGVGSGTKAQMKAIDDIDDEEKFLYGDCEEPKPPPVLEPVRHHALDLYGDVTEEALYGDCPAKPAAGQTHGLPVASPRLQALPSVVEADARYASHPTVGPDHNIEVQVGNPAYPPGTEPLEESERQALEEYEKIQDLLKTIGLDLGVAEITKMAARTKERLHGNKLPQKMSTRLRRYSSSSSDGSRGERRRRSHSGSSSSSSSRSRSWGRRRGDSRGGSHVGSWSSDEEHRKPILPKLHKDLNLKAAKPNCSDASHPLPPPPLPPAPDTQSLPHNPGMPIPTYPPTQVHGLMPPNFPPPGYSQYGNYLPYLHQQWPPMFPPPSITLPPHTGPDEVLPPSLLHKPSYSKLASESGVKGVVKMAVPDSEVDLCSRAQKVSEEQNNESQKQKVLEEREKLRHEREVRMKKKEFLMKELERLRKQQGELLRKKRREREGHKDPLLQELSRLQEDVMAQISNLRMEHEAAEKKRSEIDKVALILGLCPSERLRRAPKSCDDQSEARHPLLQEKKREAERSPEGRQVAGSPALKRTTSSRESTGFVRTKRIAAEPSKQTSAVAARSSPDRQPISVPPVAPPPEPFEYYDAGNHWCKNCNVTSGSMFDFFTHLHSKTHRKTLDPYERPWASSPSKITKNMLPEEKLTKPAKGSEFLLPVRGFFCLLCRQFYGDAICAEEHVTTHAHNEKYKKQMYENPTYEQRRNLDRQAGLALETSGKKRKHEDEEKGGKDKESKHKKDKKDKDKKKDADGPHKDEKSKAKKEREEEEQLEKSRTAEDFKNSKSLEEECLSLSKKDDGENCKYSKTDDKYRYSKEEEERLDRYKHSRNEYQHRYCRDVNDRCDRSKYDLREDNDKHRYGKYSDFRSKYERDEGKPRAEREASKKPGRPPGKPEVSKPEPLPLKPYDPPKILCGPSPAMRAKLRKQSQEASKPSTVTVGPTFGKFTWKKKEDVLAKVAEKVAAEFVKEDEAAVKQQQQVSAEDSFAKSMAVAKEIAEKLGGQHGNVPNPWVSNGANRGRIRPNLPAPAAVLRRTTMMAKPAPLNTFLSIRSQNTSSLGPPADRLSKSTATAMLEAQPTLMASRLGPAEAKPAPAASSPQQIEVKPAPPVTKLEPPLGSRLAAFEVQPAPLVSKPAPAEVKPDPVVFSPQPFPLLGSRPVSKLAPVKAKLTPFEAKPDQPAMVKIVSDVAAPGVPESEQTHTVFVKPPPFMNINDTTLRSDRQKSNLAAAKAQQLFGIFYNSTSQSGPCSITRLATDFRPVRTAVDKPPLPTQQALKTQPQPPAQSQSLPPSTPPDASISLTSPQSQTNTDIQTALPQSLQSTPGPAPEATLTTATSQRTEPKPDQMIQSQDQSVPPNKPSTSQTEPTEGQTTSQICREPHSKPDQHPLSWAQSETDADAAPEAKPKLGPKTHCSKTTLTKKALPVPGPVRQTRSQTRYQTRQQQSQSEPGPASRQSADADLKDLNSSDPGSGSQLVEEGGSPGMEVTPETLGLPSDITSLDFEFNFNFE